MKQKITPETGRAALRALIQEGSPLGPLKVMAQAVGRFFQIPLLMFHPYIVFGAEANRKVLISEREKFSWRNHDPVTDLLDRGVLVTDGVEHDHYRGLMEPPLHPHRLVDYSAMMINQTDKVSSAWKDSQTVDMLHESRKIALLIIMQTLFSKDVWDDLAQIWKPILKSIEYISPGAWILWRKMPRPSFRKPLKELDEYLFKIISDRRRLTVDHRPPSTVHGQDLLQHLIDAGLTDKIIRDQMLTMMIAGHDTSTALLAWTFALLGQHPDVHEKVLAEIDAEGKSALLEQVIKESMRLYPPIHIGNRMMNEACSFEGGTIPKGERMFYSIYLTHRDPQVWENPHDFKPERFAQGGSGAKGLNYVPFGGGPRVCIGAAFGQAEARIVLTRLLQTHRFEFLNHKIHAHMGATLEPRPGVRMRVAKRAEN